MLRAVLEEAAARGVRIHRVSQGSGIMLLTDEELDELAELGREHDVEVCLFLGPRGAWDAGRSGARHRGRRRGGPRRPRPSRPRVAEARRACAHGIRSLLVGDVGVLDVLARLRHGRPAPADLVLQDLGDAVRRQPGDGGAARSAGRRHDQRRHRSRGGDARRHPRGRPSKPLDVYVEVAR